MTNCLECAKLRQGCEMGRRTISEGMTMLCCPYYKPEVLTSGEAEQVRGEHEEKRQATT